ncbi:hypothetical protein [Burkholderia sp. BCC1047]|uniref:hypothetical protein n=1 Tax=Burkholderia sp. BCC1047 TaxID=2676299 RepID=UPI001FC8AF0B|nr:hypothetical protein [Burkholderia sp. BCC1047]
MLLQTDREGGSAGAVIELSSGPLGNLEPETIMQANARVVCRWSGNEQGKTSAESASLAAMFIGAVPGGIATPKGSLANPHVVIATTVMAAAATAPAMVS